MIKHLLFLITLPFIALGAALAWPMSNPPPLASVTDAIRAAPRVAQPEVQTFAARDGTNLAFRAFPVPEPRAIAVLIHGSAGSSRDMAALGHALAADGVTAYALDIRGQGQSGERGDIAYIGQQEDDAADFLAHIANQAPAAPRILIGHSSGGGFALKLAASPQGAPFARTILIAPYLGHAAPTTRPGNGEWARPNIPRIVALSILDRAHITALQGMPVLAFAAGQNENVTRAWSFRMMTGFAAHEDFAADIRAARAPLTVIAGADDALMYADRYAATFHATNPNVTVRVLPGVDHISAISAPTALAAIVEATRT